MVGSLTGRVRMGGGGCVCWLVGGLVVEEGRGAGCDQMRAGGGCVDCVIAWRVKSRRVIRWLAVEVYNVARFGAQFETRGRST